MIIKISKKQHQAGYNKKTFKMITVAHNKIRMTQKLYKPKPSQIRKTIPISLRIML